MKQALILLMIISVFHVTASAQDNYHITKAQSYQREAVYYREKADSYRSMARYYLKKAESDQREVAYYTKRGNLAYANIYSQYVQRALDNYKIQLRYAQQADEKAANYLKWAADELSKR